MAYVLGFIYADGNVHRSARGNYLVITSTDEHIILNIKLWMKSEHIVSKTIFTDNRKPRFAIRIGNKELYTDLLKLGVYPNKSLTVRMPEVPSFVLRDFVRGCFDGDGCISLYRSKGITQDVILRQLRVIFTSGSELFLKDLLEILKRNLCLTLAREYVCRRSFQLRFNTPDSITLFKFMYTDTPNELFFQRKFETFKTYFSLRPQRIDKEVELILRYVSEGHVVK